MAKIKCILHKKKQTLNNASIPYLVFKGLDR